jgi:hypothetical protein
MTLNEGQIMLNEIWKGLAGMTLAATVFARVDHADEAAQASCAKMIKALEAMAKAAVAAG